MPLIDATIRPGFAFRTTNNRPYNSKDTRNFVRTVIGPALPGLFIDHSAKLGLTDNTPVDAVQVQFRDYDPDDINVADIWFKVQFSEEQPDLSKRLAVRDAVFALLLGMFAEHELEVPANFILDVFWGPSHGRGRINGTGIEW